MNHVTYAVIGLGGFGGALAVTHFYVTSEIENWNAPLTNPPSTTIIVCSYNEEALIERTLQSLLNQNIVAAYPSRFELIVADSQSTDRTPEIAGKYAEVLSLPRGKLNAKHLAILDAKGEVIVSCDADTYYGCNYVNTLLKRFERPEVVAVGGISTTDDSNKLLKIGYLVQAWLFTWQKSTLIGRSSAFRKDAYLQVGGYFLDFDQTNISQVQYWEEVEIVDRFKQIGKVEIELKAIVPTSPRLFYCKPRHKAWFYPFLQGDVHDKFCGEIEAGQRM